jgi:hypothetical protein
VNLPYNLERLNLFRRNGQVPKFAVFVTNHWRLVETMNEIGAMAIHVRPEDASLDWSSMGGVDVILDVPDTDRWTPLMIAIRDAKPRRFRVFADGVLGTLWYGHA